MKPQFNSDTALLPAIVQDCHTGQVLMLAYMNEQAYEQTLASGKVTFYSRSRDEIWVKGETSGNYLHLKSLKIDCDRDAILIQAEPAGPTCHKGSYSCFGDEDATGFLHKLDEIIASRVTENVEESYTASLARKGLNKIAQKVGEEAVEVVIASKDNDKEAFIGECADLIYHLQVLLNARNFSISDIEAELFRRHNA